MPHRRKGAMKDFEYFRPKTIDEAVRAYKDGGKGARLLAGGTELVNEMRFGKTRPEVVVDLKHVRELDFMSVASESVRIGALYRVRDVEKSGVLMKSRYEALSHAAGTLGSPQVRNKATVVGNVCRASPSADLIPPLIALGAKAKIVGCEDERKVAVEKMLVGPGKTVLKEGEIVTELEIARLPSYAGCAYHKLSPRKSLDLAVVGVAVMIRADAHMWRCLDARIVLGAVAPTAIRAKRAEAVLMGGRLDGPVIKEAAIIAREEVRPIDDVRASAWYRTKMVGVVVERMIWQCLKQIEMGDRYGLWSA